MDTDTPQKLLTTEQAAEYLNVSRQKLEKYRQRDKGPRYAKLGGNVRYRPSDLDEWVEAQIVDPQEAS